MKIKRPGLILCAAFASSASIAVEGWYLEISRGQTELDSASTKDKRMVNTCNLLGCSSSTSEERYRSRFEDDTQWGVALGYGSDSYRIESEFRRYQHELVARGESLELKALLFNVWRDVELWGVAPYFGGGLGLGQMEQGSLDDELVLGQLGFGVALNLLEHFSVDVGYRRLFAESDPVLEDQSRAITRDLRADNWRLAIRYNFQ